MFAESEDWLETYLDFRHSGERYGDFAVAFRHACANAAFDRYVLSYRLHGLLARMPSLVVGGLDAFDQDYYQTRYGQSLGGHRSPKYLAWAANIALTASSFLFTLAWILIRMKPLAPRPLHFGLACDYVAHPTNAFVWEEIGKSADDILIVFRSALPHREMPADVVGRHHVVATEGWFSVLDGLRAMARTVADHGRLLHHAGSLPMDFFRRIIALCYRRIMYRALFNRFECDYFWGRDDYNPEHALRSVELRRKGGVSFGFMHGIPSIAAIVHQLRHLDFDTYYVHGRHLSERYYRDRWPETMRVVPIGSSGLSRSELKKLAAPGPRTGVACFLSITFQIAETIDAIRTLAAEFPDRIFYINFKDKDQDEPTFGSPVSAFLGEGIKNVVRHTGRSYDLFFLCDTVFSNGTTLAAEAIQLSLKSYVFDFFPDAWKSLPYRDFPGVCISSVESAIALMRSEQPFPREKWAEFIEMSGIVPWDTIRQDMNLPAKDGPLAHLALQPTTMGQSECRSTSAPHYPEANKPCPFALS
ncbi:MAG: hypothetical protein O3A84_13610 [Proteobacteria bacterium]|nr:hypothetical protein [Pseudomonadota bacterium]